MPSPRLVRDGSLPPPSHPSTKAVGRPGALFWVAGVLVSVLAACAPSLGAIDSEENDLTASCDKPPPQCGDKSVAGDEECDDGNALSGDGCSGTCKKELCGNGIVDPDEECDDGEGNGQGTLCNLRCEWTYCPAPPQHGFREDTWPVMSCIDPGTHEPVACDTSFFGRVGPSETQCTDCRGHATNCDRLGKGGEWSRVVTMSTPQVAAEANPDWATANVQCAAHRERVLAANTGNKWDPPFRFGYRLDRKALASGLAIESWCLPLTATNCGAWSNNDVDSAQVPKNPAAPDTTKDEYHAPVGCYCYNGNPNDKDRSWAKCNTGEQNACPWASGSGCGLYTGWTGGWAGPTTNVRCQPGGKASAPQNMSCHVDISGMKHDLCCLKHYYVDGDKETGPVDKKDLKLSAVECNGCRGGGAAANRCKGDVLDVSSPMDSRFACYDEWQMATSHSRTEEYMWRRVVDTEERLTPEAVVAWNGFEGESLKKKWPYLLADKNTSLLAVSFRYGVAGTSRAEVASYCKSGKAADTNWHYVEKFYCK